jgi:hypothetical protein
LCLELRPPEFVAVGAAPLFDQAPHTRRQPTAEEAARRDADYCRKPRVFDMHVRGWMVVVEEPHEYPEKHGDNRHKTYS